MRYAEQSERSEGRSSCCRRLQADLREAAQAVSTRVERRSDTTLTSADSPERVKKLSTALRNHGSTTTARRETVRPSRDALTSTSQAREAVLKTP